MPAEPTDPVTSPDPSTPSSAVETSTPAQPEPKVSAEPTAPPAASDDDPAPHVRTSDEAPDEEEILARLQGKTPKKDTPSAPAAEAVPTTPEAKADEAAAPDPTAEFKLPEKAEIDAYHSKTRHRVKSLVDRIEQREPFAKYGEAVLKEAEKHGVTNQQLNAWLEVGFLAKNGHPDALPVLANILKNAGYKNADLAPAVEAQPQFDTAAIEAALAKAYDNADISESGLREIRKTLAATPKPAPAAPQAPKPEVRAAPQVAPPINYQAEALTRIGRIKAEYAAEYGPRWKQAEPEIAKELASIESKIADRNVLNDPSLWPQRMTRAIERVLNRPSAPALSSTPVTPSLRASSSPTPPPAPLQPGTAEYEDALLTGRIAVKKR